jgi:hypothetical protein
MIGSLPLFLLFIFVEWQSIPRFSEVVNLDYLTLLVFGVSTSELFSVCGAVLKECPGFGFAEDIVPLNCLSVLLISYVLYGETVYWSGVWFGILFIHIGYVMHSIVQEGGGKAGQGGDADSLVQLLSEARENAANGD